MLLLSRRGSLIREHAAFNRAEVDEIEAVTNHDVIAFLTNKGSTLMPRFQR